MKITGHSIAGTSINEDATTWLLSDNGDAAMLCVIDGASGLGGLQASGWATDAEWFAQSIAKGLVQAAEGELDPRSLLAESLRLSRLTPEAINVLSGSSTAPTAGVAIVVVSGDRVCAATLGDPTIAILRLDHADEVIHDSALTILDTTITQAMMVTARRRATRPENVKQEFKQLLRRNRALANRPDGYWVADLEGKGLDHMVQRAYPRSQVQAIVAATDGFAMVVGAHNPYHDWRSVYNDCSERGLQTVLNGARDLILEDEDWRRFPRFSKCDDMTLAVLELA